jgi:hypothetical protein
MERIEEIVGTLGDLDGCGGITGDEAGPDGERVRCRRSGEEEHSESWCREHVDLMKNDVKKGCKKVVDGLGTSWMRLQN